MKYILLGLVFCSHLTFAKAKEQGSFDVKDSSTGSFSMIIKYEGEPVYSPYSMTLTARCKGQKNTTELIKGDSICEFHSHNYDRKTKTLLITFSTSELAPGPAQCNTKWAQAFKLNEVCVQKP